MGLKSTLCRIFASNAASTEATFYSSDPKLSPEARKKFGEIGTALRNDTVDKLPDQERNVALHLFRRKVKREKSDETIRPNREGGLGYG